MVSVRVLDAGEFPARDGTVPNLRVTPGRDSVILGTVSPSDSGFRNQRGIAATKTDEGNLGFARIL